jgi:hypothetical protein
MNAKRRRRTSIEGAFAPRLVEMLESPAFRVLSLSARRVLDRLEIELAHHGGQDNGRLPCTFMDFQRFGIDRHAIAPAIRECIALGFLIYEPGAAGNADFRRPNHFHLTYRHTDHADPLHAWRRVTSEDEALSLALAARRSEKQKAGVGKRTVSVGVSHTEMPELPVGVSHTTGPVGVSHTTSRSRGGTAPSIRPEPRAAQRASEATGDASTTAGAISADLQASADRLGAFMSKRPRLLAGVITAGGSQDRLLHQIEDIE